MTRWTGILAAFAAVLFGAVAAHAFVAGNGPERVRFPEGYATAFQLYDIVDKPERKRARYMYIDRASLAAATAGAPLPNGTVIVMEDHEVELTATGEPARGADGRLRPTPVVTAVFVMEKRSGWGATIPAEVRNGDWDYAAFRPNGTPSVTAEQTRSCHACHLPQAGASDYTFTTLGYLRRR